MSDRTRIDVGVGSAIQPRASARAASLPNAAKASSGANDVDAVNAPTVAPQFDEPADDLEATRLFWQRYAKRELSREDAREITANIVGFFGVLQDWKRAELSAQATEDDTSGK